MKPRLFERGFHPTEVTRRARDHDVIEETVAAPTIREDVVELEPHALECRVLAIIR
ncbi:hypothetical protein [Sphingopyxis sp. L1A2A]|uniref:hypothetical protein n=1 Tax=Sphingopyxis sp. L1A2A TaxID=2502247 RepID=UPI0020161B7E|nr:hypothetical protein [Sphingopyxis sp. L1A2A]